jgi:hypothetical protein
MHRFPGQVDSARYEFVSWCVLDNSQKQYAEVVMFMVFNITFNNIPVISWQSVLLVEETGVPVENHDPAASHWQTLSHTFVSSTPRHERGSNSHL